MSENETLDLSSIMKICPFKKSKDWSEDDPILLPINIKELRESCKHGKLKDAIIFKYLFGFECGNFKKMDHDYVFDFRKYNITFNEWSVFIQFLKYDKGIWRKNKNTLLEICTKFGGIPAFDRWYQNQMNRRTKKMDVYNPMTPKEDTKNLYIWRGCGDTQLLTFADRIRHKEYSIAGSEYLGSISKTYFWRKLKKGVGKELVEDDEDGVYSEHTIGIDDEEVLQVHAVVNAVEVRQVAMQNNENVYDDMHDFREDVLDMDTVS